MAIVLAPFTPELSAMTETETVPACSIDKAAGVAIDLDKFRQKVIVAFQFTNQRHVEQERRAALQATLTATIGPAVEGLPSVHAAERLERTRRECVQQLQALRERLPAIEQERNRLLV